MNLCIDCQNNLCDDCYEHDCDCNLRGHRNCNSRKNNLERLSRNARALALFAQSPTPAQLAALRDYARDHGRYWKRALLGDWMNGRCSGPLQQLRNAYGPSWLMRLKLGKEEV